MTPNAQTDPIEMTWSERLKHCRAYRVAVKKSFGDTLNNVQVVQLTDGSDPVIFAVGGPEPQTVVSGRVTESTNDVALAPLFPMTPTTGEEARGTPSAEVQLFYERMRSHVVSGITGYSWHERSGCMLLTSISRLQILRKGEVLPVAEWYSGTILNAAMSLCDPEFVAFTSTGRLFIDLKNTEFYASPADDDQTAGVASFITQEELERFEGFWWNPERTEILFEQVDESGVAVLSFDTPGKRSSESMKYPLAGTINPTSRLRLLSLDKYAPSAVVRDLPIELKDLFPWCEYVARAGWVDGDFAYAVLMNRCQTDQALVIIHREAFGSTMGIEELRAKYVLVVNRESSNIWINVNNLLHFLPSPGPGLRFIYGSEKNDHCHLYLQTCQLERVDDACTSLFVTKVHDVAVTSGEWPVIKETPVSVDAKRCQVYFLANRHSPVITSLCVTSYSCESDVNVLTPAEMSYRQERRQFSLNVNPDIGFVAWLSSADSLPECRFYRLLHDLQPPSPSSPLPDAVFHCRLTIQPSISSPSSLSSLSKFDDSNSIAGGSPTALLQMFTSHFFEYHSAESGRHHCVGVFLPNRPANTASGKFPVIQHVYAGPSVQIVKNSWSTVAQFMKFISVGYAVVIVDGRGSSNRGISFEAPIKNALGTVETRDQVDGLLEAGRRFGQLDMSRVVVTGWSYGGYMSLLLLSNFPSIYRAACAGGAVSDWTLYDTCYTERYMDLPKNNIFGYKSSSIVTGIQKFPNEEGRLLIVHGLIDENVHFQHAEQLVNALLAVGKPFEQLFLPSERHGIREGSSIEFFHARMLNFFDRALKTPSFI